MSTEQTATFAAGCFWEPEEHFRRLPGILATRVGYAGGEVPHPTYKQVCSGGTGHAEAVQVTFDPDRVSYDELLAVFWAIHDPTQVDRQGPNRGSQYRSMIFAHDEHQRRLAEQSKAAQQGNHTRPVATEIVDASEFYEAEEYHQRFYEKRAWMMR